jgi:outer membrane biosynthesis protein TonB
MEAVTAVLVDRERAARGLNRMVAWSFALHVSAAVLMAFGAGRLLGGPPAQTNRIVMEVSLGGAAAGPDTGGSNPLGGRPVQQVVRTPEAKPQPLRTPAAKTPAMTVPVPDLKPRSKPPKAAEAASEVKTAPEGARGRLPTTGPQEKFGESFAETGADGLAMGLATGGAGTGGSSLDVGNFCCPDYLRVMARRIRENWNYRQGVAGTTVLRFTIQRDGRITDIGNMLDLIAQNALKRLERLPQLPPAYTFQSLTVYLKFEYQR